MLEVVPVEVTRKVFQVLAWVTNFVMMVFQSRVTQLRLAQSHVTIANQIVYAAITM